MTLSAKNLGAAALPVVDVSGLISGDATAQRAVARAIKEACLDKGFMYIVGHGIAPELRSEVFKQSAAFFDLPEAHKLAVDMKLSSCNRGYEAMRAQTLEAGAPPDLKESFYSGRHLEPDHPAVLAGKFNHGPNQWPAGMSQFQDVMDRYYLELETFGAVLMRGVALSLDLAADYFDGFCTDPQCGLRLIHYPPQPAHAAPNEKGCGAHTDWGGLTILAQDEVGGLQVWDDTVGWVHAPPMQDAYIVNLGDMIARWTNERYRSTLHRVVNATGKERYSVPFFYSGNPDYEVACISSCLGPGETPKFPPTTVSGHMREMYAKTYAS
ncbi:MAG: 2-oxoglutarate and iron-dependent oxygenase domain-containing protein [Pseudomonadota bacterium]